MKGFDPTNYKPPGAYVHSMLDTVRHKDSGELLYKNFKWTPRSVKIRFRLLITTLRFETTHPLSGIARKHEWKWLELGQGRFRIMGVPKELVKKS